MTAQPILPIRALNLYYARELGLRDEVLATRLRASEVRAAIGIPRGRIFRRVEGDAELPDVMWDCPFADPAGHERDMDARAASAEFEAVRAHMRSMLRRFGRVLYEVTLTAAMPPPPNDPASRITQLWLQCANATPIDADRLLASIERAGNQASITLLRRRGSDIALPEWIVESPGIVQPNLSQSLTSAFSQLPGGSVLTSVWERCM